MKHIEVVQYNDDWPKMFEQEAASIKQALGNNCIEIHHVGSTSIPGLSAKPIIDIIAVTKVPENTIEPLKSLGFEYKGEYNIPMHFGFNKKEDTQVNLHVYEQGNPEIKLNILFRDYLRAHPEACQEYAELKNNLLLQKPSYEKNNRLVTGYNMGKDAFIRNILDKAGFNEIRIVRCAHYHDWEESSMDFLIGKVFYLRGSKDQPEEMYYVTLVSEKMEDTTWTKPSYLGIRALNIIDGNNQWKTNDNIANSEWERIDARFEKEIISQIQNSQCGCKHVGFRE